MPERDHDPIASTQLFRAFVQRDHADHAEPAGRRRVRTLVLTVILAVVVLGVIVGVLLAR
jgi:hypothetical protein